MKKIKIGLCPLFLMLVVSCHQEEVIEIKGDIMGFAKLLDENGFELDDKSNIKVTLDDKHNTLTNSAGRFEFNDITPGTYRVTFEKEGFGTFKKFNYIFTAGNVPGVITDINLVALPSITLLTQQVVSISPYELMVSGTMAETDSFYIRYYLVGQPDADISDYSKQYGTYNFSSCCIKKTNFQHYIFLQSNLPSPCYIVGYAVSRGNTLDQVTYYDPEKGWTVNPAMKKLFEPVKIK